MFLNFRANFFKFFEIFQKSLMSTFLLSAFDENRNFDDAITVQDLRN